MKQIRVQPVAKISKDSSSEYEQTYDDSPLLVEPMIGEQQEFEITEETMLETAELIF